MSLPKLTRLYVLRNGFAVTYPTIRDVLSNLRLLYYSNPDLFQSILQICKDPTLLSQHSATDISLLIDHNILTPKGQIRICVQKS